MTEEKRKLFLKLMDDAATQDICVAFSGGVDSSLILKAAKDATEKHGTCVYAVTFETNLHPSADLAIAKKVAETIGAVHVVLYVNEFDNSKILDNPVNRCYLCKKMLFEKLLAFAKEKHAGCVMEGTNADDLLVYRPGLAAVRELQVKSPLAEAGMTKAEVREMAGALNLSVSNRPSAPCLATRLPYGTHIDPELLQRIDQGEMYLKSLGMKQVRIRQHGDITRIEVPADAFTLVIGRAAEIVEKLHKLGFRYITLDLAGFRSGSMDEYLEQ